jgi:hypothetical protein
MDGSPHGLEYANLRCTDPAVIHFEQFHIVKIYII